MVEASCNALMSKSCVSFKKIVFTRGFTWFSEKNETRTHFVKIEKMFLCNNQFWFMDVKGNTYHNRAIWSRWNHRLSLSKKFNWIVELIWLKINKLLHMWRVNVQIWRRWHQHKNLWWIVNFLVWRKNSKALALAMHFPNHASMGQQKKVCKKIIYVSY